MRIKIEQVLNYYDVPLEFLAWVYRPGRLSYTDWDLGWAFCINGTEVDDDPLYAVWVRSDDGQTLEKFGEIHLTKIDDYNVE